MTTERRDPQTGREIASAPDLATRLAHWQGEGAKA